MEHLHLLRMYVGESNHRGKKRLHAKIRKGWKNVRGLTEVQKATMSDRSLMKKEVPHDSTMEALETTKQRLKVH